jgi:hypothetical protein
VVCKVRAIAATKGRLRAQTQYRLVMQNTLEQRYAYRTMTAWALAWSVTSLARSPAQRWWAALQQPSVNQSAGTHSNCLQALSCKQGQPSVSAPAATTLASVWPDSISLHPFSRVLCKHLIRIPIMFTQNALWFVRTCMWSRAKRST